ncbi:beta-lactamase-like protein [Sulfuricella denitrificans skB26]|uniref:Beta-lactamase-like protein n=1 Tax=Sulfuricella denitrificans (strain DSM 22764 / NBRC 105220 / skB26) TaxID=1163617 RepID=S6AAB1_SULDS|nr:MBL fold metallo-hydrolase [Sulfuricella denitrificans]BAN35550.1 beta-lactamase-like protein [Sulfuricella denitrificans skB26]
MTETLQDYDDGIAAIDAQHIRPGLAAIHLLVEGDKAAFIDTGTNCSVPGVLEAMQRKNLRPENIAYVIVTHVHLDHAGGAGEMMRLFPEAMLVVHPRGARHMIDPTKLVAGSVAVYGKESFRRAYGEIVPVSANRVIEASHGFTLDLNGRRLLFLDTPGHARHHFCVFDERSKGVFTGDTFGISYREFDVDGREFIFPTTTPVQFEPEAAHDSIDLIMSHHPRAAYLTHYGRVTQLSRLADDLHRTLDDFVDIAEGVRDTGAVRHQRLVEGLGNYLLERLNAHGCRLSHDEALTLLENDIELNAQGLAVWMDRG